MNEMTAEFRSLDQLLQDGTVDQLVDATKASLSKIVETADAANQVVPSEISIAQSVIGLIALILVGITFLPFGATPSSIKACQLNTDQKLLKYLGVVVVVMTSISAVLYLELLKAYGLLANI